MSKREIYAQLNQNHEQEEKEEEKEEELKRLAIALVAVIATIGNCDDRAAVAKLRAQRDEIIKKIASLT